MGQVFLLALTASVNPTLVAATSVMLLLANPAKLMTGYLLGALMTRITLGGLALVAAWGLWTGRHERFSERRRARRAAKADEGRPSGGGS